MAGCTGLNPDFSKAGGATDGATDTANASASDSNAATASDSNASGSMSASGTGSASDTTPSTTSQGTTEPGTGDESGETGGFGVCANNLPCIEIGNAWKGPILPPESVDALEQCPSGDVPFAVWGSGDAACH